jgi:calcineurin-like phosphoesterase family protein
MIKVKKNSADYKNIYITSDFHYGHNRDFLYKPRGFSDAIQHQDWLDKQISTLQYDDLLICLGDVGLSIGAERIINFLNRIPCETLMVWGNHNSGVLQAYNNALPPEFKHKEVYPLNITSNITMMGESFLLDIDHNKFYCTHMSPLIYHDQGKGRACICGHSHGNLKQINPHADGFGKILDCGVENSKAYNGTAFFKLKEVVDILAKKRISVLDHH